MNWRNGCKWNVASINALCYELPFMPWIRAHGLRLLRKFVEPKNRSLNPKPHFLVPRQSPGNETSSGADSLFDPKP